MDMLSTNSFLPRHEQWRLFYRKNRYAVHLSQEELNVRIQDLMINMTTLEEAGKLGLLSLQEGGEQWWQLFTHMLEETVLRYGPAPNGLEPWKNNEHNPLINLSKELGHKAVKAMQAYDLKSKDVLIKYGSKKYMTALYESGVIKIRPASYYAQKENNYAIKDDELAIQVSLAFTKEKIDEFLDNTSQLPEHAAFFKYETHIKAKGDYWLYCLSKMPQNRMFVDFNADACVIIRNPKKFKKLLKEKTISKMGPYQFKETEYMDPLLPHTLKMNVPFTKHFSFSYQKEARFVWSPLKKVLSLEDIDVELGPLNDFADLITL